MKRTVAVAALLLILVSSGWGQERRLSEIAGSIRLRSPEGEAALIDLEPASWAGRQTGIGGANLVELSESLVESLDAVSGLLDEIRNNAGFYDVQWRQRMTDACTDLDDVSRTLQAADVPSRYSRPMDQVVEAARVGDDAVDMMESAIESNQPSYGPAFEMILTARKAAKAGAARVRQARLLELEEAEPAPEDPLEAERSIASTCRRIAGEGWAFDDCVSKQRAALDALASRFSSTVGVDEARFNTVRNRCREENPEDYVARDRCELRNLSR